MCRKILANALLLTTIWRWWQGSVRWWQYPRIWEKQRLDTVTRASDRADCQELQLYYFGETLLLQMGTVILSLSVSKIRWELTSVQIVNKPWLYCQRSKSQRLSAQILGEKQTRNTRALTIASIADKPLTLWKLRCCRIQKSETKERILKKKHRSS